MARKRAMWAVAIGILLAPAPAWAQSADEVVYYHTDAIGSVRIITDATGAVIDRYDYLPFGERWAPPPQPTPDAREFAGKERDAETGLDHFGARYYSSANGRFTSVDPVVPIEDALLDPQRWNRYTYVMNRPLTATDPDGRCPQCAMWAQRVAQLASQVRNGCIQLGDTLFQFAGQYKRSRQRLRRSLQEGSYPLALTAELSSRVLAGH